MIPGARRLSLAGSPMSARREASSRPADVRRKLDASRLILLHCEEDRRPEDGGGNYRPRLWRSAPEPSS
jgi:hypothetical protein